MRDFEMVKNSKLRTGTMFAGGLLGVIGGALVATGVGTPIGAILVATGTGLVGWTATWPDDEKNACRKKKLAKAAQDEVTETLPKP